MYSDSDLNGRAHLNSKEYYEDRILALEKAFFRIYQTKSKPDVEIHLKSEELVYFKAHKLILATRSPVFADLFRNTSNSNAEVVTVDGVTENGLELLLEYIYNDNLKTKTVDELIEVMKAALRFAVTEIVRNCKRQLSKYPLSIDNVFYVLEATKYFKMELMHGKCMRFIKSASQELLFKASGFLQLSGLSIYNILRQRNTSSGFEAHAMEGVIRWLGYNKIKGRQLLSEINILSLTSEEFLTIIEKFPYFFTYREIASVLSNMLRPGCNKIKGRELLSEKKIFSLTSEEFLTIIEKFPYLFTHREIANVLYNTLRPGCMELPTWCRSRDKFILKTATYDSVVSKSLQFKTDCSRSFTKYSLYGGDGFHESITFEIKLSKQFPKRSYLTMLELGFGSSFVPEDHLQLQLFHFEGGLKMANVEFSLQATNYHYYIILTNLLRVTKNYPSVLKMNIQVSGLRAWGVNGPVSNRKYRVAQVPEDIFYNIRLKAVGYDPISLTPLSDWLLLLDPARCEKMLILTSFYFDL